MFTLYAKNGTCSMAVHVLLNELNQPVTMIPHTVNDKVNPELLKVNPRGQVPVLQKDDMIMREGGAILTWLCDEYNSPLLPRKGAERANVLQWLMFANATLHPAYARAFFVMKNAQADKDALLKTAVEAIQVQWNEVEAQLQKTDYVCGKDCMVADILLTVIANWSQYIPMPINFGAKTKAMFKHVIARPSYQKAIEVEHVEYKAAA